MHVHPRTPPLHYTAARSAVAGPRIRRLVIRPIRTTYPDGDCHRHPSHSTRQDEGECDPGRQCQWNLFHPWLSAQC